MNNQFVSRGGIKLQSAIVNLICLDVGSSTGGFVDCLLQNGAKKVYAVDTAFATSPGRKKRHLEGGLSRPERKRGRLLPGGFWAGRFNNH